MRISDWSSDVCSSDLLNVTPRVTLPVPESWGNVTALANIYYQSLIAFDPVNRFNGNPTAALSVPGSTAPSYTRIDLRLDWRRIAGRDRKSKRLTSSHYCAPRMPSSA